MTFRVLALSGAVAATLAPALAMADEGPLAYNIGAVSDYRYRGISQSKLEPALQGGIDGSVGPIYVGTWLSTIEWVHDAGKAVGADSGDAPVEWDLYGGTKGEIAKDVSYDVGVLAYVYAGERFHDVGLANPDTGEVYGAVTAGAVTAKVSISATNLFGVPDSKGSQYYDLSATFDLGQGFSITPHAGYQNITGSAATSAGLSYSDYSLTLGKDFGKGVSGSLAVVATDATRSGYQTSDGKFTGRTGAVVGIKYTF
jgi:uncharacterized protein (TIGR02001 family)